MVIVKGADLIGRADELCRCCLLSYYDVFLGVGRRPE
jgi:hypothetical protein